MDFQINDKVVHKNGGVFIIESIQKMSMGEVENFYYKLVPYYKDAQRSMLTIYVPQDKAADLMRPILKKDKAEELFPYLETIEPLWFKDLKTRKEKFSSLLASGKVKDVCVVLKSLFAQQKQLSLENKSLNLIDYDYFTLIKNNIIEELSLSLDQTKQDVECLILKHIE